MTIKIITYNQLSEAVRIAFYEDQAIYSMYNPNVKVECLEDIVKDIPSKIKTFSSAILVGIYERDELVGYFAYQGRILISFSLAVKYRVRKYLREFFNIINKELKKDFVVYLWKRNSRATRFLEKHGMEVYEYGPDIVKIICPTNELIYN